MNKYTVIIAIMLSALVTSLAFAQLDTSEIASFDHDRTMQISVSQDLEGTLYSANSFKVKKSAAKAAKNHQIKLYGKTGKNGKNGNIMREDESIQPNEGLHGKQEAKSKKAMKAHAKKKATTPKKSKITKKKKVKKSKRMKKKLKK